MTWNGIRTVGLLPTSSIWRPFGRTNEPARLNKSISQGLYRLKPLDCSSLPIHRSPLGGAVICADDDMNAPLHVFGM